MRFPETLWVAGSSPAGGATHQVNGMLTFAGRTDPARWDLYGPLSQQSLWQVWDSREVVSRHSTGLEAHRSCVNTRYVSPDSGRKLWLYDPMGRIVAVYVDGREQLNELSGSAFPSQQRGGLR